MATGTAAVVPAPRQAPRQVINSLKKTVNWNDVGIGAGVAFDASLPMGAFVVDVLAEIVTPFNAGTTNVLTVGTNASRDDIIAAGDVDESTAAVTRVTTGLGRSLAAAADKIVYAKYAQTGAAATAGQAVIVIVYEGGWAS
jgi:hypothetical protein